MVASNTPEDLMTRITALEKLVAQLSKRAGLGNASVTSGDFTLQGSGTLRVKNPAGGIVAKIGYLGVIAGQSVYGAQFFRHDGTEAIVVYGSDATDFGAFRDVNGHIIFSDNSAGDGIATPHLNYPLPVSHHTADWPNTTALVMTVLSESFSPIYSPRVRVWAQFFGNGGTGVGDFTLNGVTIAGPVTIPNGSFVQIDQTVDLTPFGWGSTIRFHDEVTWNLRAKSDTGSGMFARMGALYGQQLP